MAITLGTEDPIHVNTDANSASRSTINHRNANTNDIPGPPALAWPTLMSCAPLTCLPCLRHVPSDDSLNNQGGHRTTNRDSRTYNQHTPYNSAINNIPRARPDELQGLLIPASSSSSSFPFGSSSHAGEGDAANDNDALSLHSNIGGTSFSRKNRHWKRRSKGKSGGLKKISLFGWNLFGIGSRSGRIRLSDDDDEDLSGGPARIERTKSTQSERSTLTFDSDAAPLSASVIDEFGASASTSLVSPPPGDLVDLPPSTSHGSMETPPSSELVDFSSPSISSPSSPPDIQASDDEPTKLLSPGGSDQPRKSRKPRKSSAHKEQKSARARLERLKSQGILPESGNGEEFEGFQGSGSAAPPVVPRTSEASRTSWTSGSEGTSEGRASRLRENRRTGLEDADRDGDGRSGSTDDRRNGKPHQSMVAALLSRRSAATVSESSTSDSGRYASAVGSDSRGVGSHPVSPDLMAPLSPQNHEHSPTDFDVITTDDYEGHREEGEEEADLGGGMYVSGARRRGYGGSAGRSQGSGSGSGFRGDGGSQGRYGGDNDIGGSHGSAVGEGGSSRAGRNETQGVPVYEGGEIIQPRTILSEVPHTKKKSKKTSSSASRSVASSGSAGRTYSTGVTSPLATSSSASFPHHRESSLYTPEDEFGDRQGPLGHMVSPSTVEQGLGFFDAEDLVPPPPAAKHKHGPRKSGGQKRAETATSRTETPAMSTPATPTFAGFQASGGSDGLVDMGIPPPPKTQIGARGDFPMVGFGGRARGFSTGAAGFGGPNFEAGSMRRFGGGASGGGEREAAKFLANTGEID